MALTNLRRKTSYYRRVIKEAEKTPHAEEYKAVCDALKDLMDFSRDLDKPGAKMSGEKYESLKANYRAVQEQCSKYLNSEKEFSEFEETHKYIIKDISLLLERDMKVLEACNPKEPGTLSQVISKSRSHTIVLKNRDIHNVGGALSSRIPLKKHDGTRGYFTQKSINNNDKKWADAIDRYIEKSARKSWFTERCREQLESLKKDGKWRKELCYYCPGQPLEDLVKNPQYKKRAEQILINVGWVVGLSDKNGDNAINVDIAAKYKADKNLKKDITEFIRVMSPLVNQSSIMMDTGIKKDANLSSRNCAMSEMAQLLGCENLLAKSTPMTVKIDGQEVEGVFMETVDGSDIKNLKPDDPIFDAREDSFESPQALRQITDLQVLDFICGNTDRHMGNMIYQFKRTDFGVVLAGIKGIDNDCAFGTPKIEKGKPIMKMVNPEDMQFITESMWNTLQGINKENVEFKLKLYTTKGHLSKDEVDAVCDRLEKVKAAVDKTIRVIPDDYWEKNSFMDADLEKDNYLSRIQDIANSCGQLAFHREKENYKQVHYIRDRRQGNRVMFSDEQKERITKLREQMNDAEALFYNSKEYDIMEKNFKKIEKLDEYFRKNYPDKKDIPENEVVLLEEAYMGLAETTLKYVQLKKLVPYQVRGQKRVQLAHDLMDFANDLLDRMGLNPEMEAESEKDQNLIQNENTEMENEGEEKAR